MREDWRIRKLAEDDLPMVLAWRNDISVRSFMFTRHEIGLQEHRDWFARAGHDPRRALLIVENGDGPAGYVQFSGVCDGGVSDWGFYARPGAPKGTGTLLGAIALDHAFAALRLHKVCGQALGFNEASIALHKRLGFAVEGVLRDQHLIDGAYHALLCFGLLRNEWQPGRFRGE